jgi:hypothetical protein
VIVIFPDMTDIAHFEKIQALPDILGETFYKSDHI